MKLDANLAVATWVLLGLVVVPPFAMGEAPIRLTDVTSESGVTFRHSDGSHGDYYIVEYVCAGMALFDYDNDGDIDVYFLSGAPADGQPAKQGNSLFRNDGDWQFTDVTVEAGVGDTHHGLGVAAADYNNDGLVDLYVNNYGPNVLYHNNGDGTFSDRTEQAGVRNGEKVGAGVCFLDIEGDGDLDLYVANYLKFSIDVHVPRTRQGNRVYASPLDYVAEPDTLFRNNGDGTFSDVSREAGVAKHVGYGMGTVCSDFDNDGDTDIIVGNDTGANFLFENDGKGRFNEIGLVSSIAYDRMGKIQGTMGIDCADYDNDGFFDFHVTSYQHEFATLYRNIGGTFLEDVTNVSGAGRGTRSPVTWGNGFADFDNDGHRDIFIASGHLYDNVDRFDEGSSYNARNLVIRNLGSGKLDLLDEPIGTGMEVVLSSRGAGLDDLDNDGDIDVVVLNSRREPTMIRNDSNNDHGWLQVDLQGIKSNRDGVGARVEVKAGDLTLVDEVRSGRGYQGHFGSRLHFGLGDQQRVDLIRIRWPSGTTDEHRSVDANRRYTAVEGGSLTLRSGR